MAKSQPIDRETKFREIYESGQSPVPQVKALGISHTSYYSWLKRNGLRPRGKSKPTTKPRFKTSAPIAVNNALPVQRRAALVVGSADEILAILRGLE